MNKHEQLDHDFPNIEYDNVLRETPKAIFFQVGDKQVWIPTSQLEDLDVVEKVFNIPRWLAIKNELIEEEL